MNKKILVLAFFSLLNTISYSDETGKLKIGKVTSPREELIIKKINSDTPIDETILSNNTINKIKSSSNYIGGGGGIHSVGHSVNLDRLFDTLDNYYEIANKGTELAFNAVSRAADSATVSASIAGSSKFMSGIATTGSNIQLILQKLLMMRKRVDDLKQYKRFLDSVRTLSKEDLKTLAGISNTLSRLDRIVTEGFDLEEKTINMVNVVKDSDLKTIEGWENILIGDYNIKNINDETLDRISGKEAKKVIEILNDTKQKIRDINPKNATQEISKLNSQISLLISLFEKQMSDQAAIATKNLIVENKKVEEEIAEKKNKQDKLEQLLKYEEKLKKQYPITIKSANKFSGDVWRD